jgi:hypothetical protein
MRKPVFRKPIDVSAPLREFCIQALARLCKLYDFHGGDWTPVAEFYDACGSLALCDTFIFQAFLREMALHGLINVKRGRVNPRAVLTHVAPAKRPMTSCR